jgi:hypothetical protein
LQIGDESAGTTASIVRAAEPDQPYAARQLFQEYAALSASQQ